MDSGSTKILLNHGHNHGHGHHHVSNSGNVVGMKRKSSSSMPSTIINGNNSMLSTNGNLMSSYIGGGITQQYQQQQQQQQQQQYNNIPNGWGANTMVSTTTSTTNGGLTQTGNITSVGSIVQACSKCGGKKRHSKTCIYRRDDEGDAVVPSKDVIQRLDVAALKRYKKHYRLKTKHNSSKAELASIVRNHFDGLPVNEGEIIENFMFKVKNVPTINQ